MRFLAPQWLAVAFLVVPVLWLHMRRARSVRVPSLRLWSAIVTKAAHRPTLRRPPLTLPLALQILAVLAAALALAEPSFGDRPAHRIFILDAALHGDDTQRAAQLDAEKQALQQQLRLAPAEPADRVSILVAGAVPAIVGARLDDVSALATPLGRIGAQDGAIDVSRVGDLVHEIAAGGEATSALLLGPDTAASGRLAKALAPLDLKVQSVPGAVAPTEALSLAVAPISGAAGKWSVRGEARLSSAQPDYALRVLFEPEGAGAFAEQMDQKLTASPDATLTPVSADLTLPSSGALVVQLLRNAEVVASYRAVLGGNLPRVLVIGKSTGALVDALKALPNLKLFAADNLPDDDAAFDLVIVNDAIIARQPDTNTLWAGAARLNGDAEPSSFAATPTRWDSNNDLSQGVDWPGFTASKAFGFPLLAGAEAVAEQAAGPLLQARTLRTGRDVRFAVDIDSSNWPNRADLPILLHDILAWSGISTVGPQADACVVGQVCPLPPRLLAGGISLMDEQVGSSAVAPSAPAVPAAAVHDQAGWLDADADRAFVPQRAGIYRLERNGRAAYLAVNPAPESAAPAEEPAVEVGGAIWQPAPWWLLLALTALLILAELGVAGWVVERFLRPDALSGSDRHHVRHRSIGIAGILACLAVLAGVAGAPLWLPKPVARIMLWDKIAPVAADDAGRVAIGAAPRIVADLGGGAVATSGGTAGNLADSLQLATAMAGGRPARLLLQGQGAQSAWLAALPQLQAASLPVDVEAAPAAPGDIVVEGVEGPAQAYAGDGLTLHALVHSPAPVSATVTVSRDGKLVNTRNVRLLAGSNRLDLPAGNVAAGNPLYEVAVEASGDPVPENSRNAIRITVRSGPRVGIVASQPAAANAFAAALALQGLQPKVMTGDTAPTSLDQWLGYDVVALMDLPAAALTTAQQQQLQSAVRDHGHGLLMLGGQSSFGPGGYDQTPLDAMSPLSSRIPQDMPKTGLIFVIDRSSSMQLDAGGASRLTIAKAAAIKAIRLLNPASMVGVVAFDTLALPVVALQQVDDTSSIETALNMMEPGGGTSIYPGLELAYRMLRDAPYPSRHIIVISDGQSQAGDFRSLEQQITNSGITVSAIAIGADADPGVLSDIATAGQGIFYWSRDFHALPSLLSQETLMATASPIKRGPIQPVQIGKPADFLADTHPPSVDGYVETSVKTRAQLDWSVHNDKDQEMPVLAHWQFGEGQVLGLTTQAAGDWVDKWVADPSYPHFWSGVVRAFAPAPTAPGAWIDLRRDGDEVVVSAEQPDLAPGEAAGTTLVAGLTMPDASAPRDLTLARQRDGSYQARFAAGREGDYSVTLPDGSAATIHIAFSAALAAPRPGDDPGGIAKATGGNLLAAGDMLPQPGVYWSAAPNWRLWACLGLIIFLVSLVVRYRPPLRALLMFGLNNRNRVAASAASASTPTIPSSGRRTAT
ncbi:MAG TPA: VWA domain-containing protein [Devosiaceae bacterium]|jgi:hypothetical protein